MFFDFDGVRIAYETAGDGELGPVLFLHNLGASRLIWAPQMRVLARTRRVFAVDWPGYGDSEAPGAANCTIEWHQELLDAFVAEHGLSDLTIVGNCFGSAMALEYARRHSADVRALILANPLTAATLHPTLSGLAARVFRRIPVGGVVRQVRIPSAVARLIVKEQLGTASSAESDAELGQLASSWTTKGRLLALVRMLPELPRLSMLDGFRPPADFPPITVIWGEQNRILDAETGLPLAEAWNAQRIVAVPDGGHLVMLEHPELVTAEIENAVDIMRA